MRMSDWSSDVCSSDLTDRFGFVCGYTLVADDHRLRPTHADQARQEPRHTTIRAEPDHSISSGKMRRSRGQHHVTTDRETRSEEHTSELQSLMRISYAVFCLKKKTTKQLRKIMKKS